MAAGEVMGEAVGWGWPVAAGGAGVVLGAVVSVWTRRFVPGRVLAGSWWLGALLTAAVLTLLGWRLGGRGELVVVAVVAVFAVPLVVIDWCEHRLPRAVVWPQLATAVTGFAVLCVLRGDVAPGLRVLAGMLAAAVLFLVLAVLSGGVGGGDVPVAAVVGVVTGWFGWAHLATALALASALAVVLLAVPAARQRDDRGKVVVPFGPCLFGGALLVVLYG